MSQSLQGLIRANLNTVVALEQELYQEFSRSERGLHRLTLTFGRLPVLLGHLALIAIWIFFNSAWSPFTPIDPWPHDALILALATESIALMLLVLIAQRIMERLDNHRALLSLQIHLLNEQETTKALAVLRRIETHLGIAGSDESLAAMTEQTDPGEVSSAIQQAVSTEKPGAQ